MLFFPLGICLKFYIINAIEIYSFMAFVPTPQRVLFRVSVQGREYRQVMKLGGLSPQQPLKGKHFPGTPSSCP